MRIAASAQVSSWHSFPLEAAARGRLLSAGQADEAISRLITNNWSAPACGRYARVAVARGNGGSDPNAALGHVGPLHAAIRCSVCWELV